MLYSSSVRMLYIQNATRVFLLICILKIYYKVRSSIQLCLVLSSAYNRASYVNVKTKVRTYFAYFFTCYTACFKIVTVMRKIRASRKPYSIKKCKIKLCFKIVSIYNYNYFLTIL